MLTFAEQIKIMLKRRGMTLGGLADMTGQSRQNLSNKINRDNFSQREMQQIAEALGCDLTVHLTDRDTKETI